MNKPTIPAISSDPTIISSNISSEESTSIISESNDLIMNEISEGEKNTCHYVEVAFSSPCPIAPPTSSGVPVQYSIIGGHLNTMVIY